MVAIASLSYDADVLASMSGNVFGALDTADADEADDATCASPRGGSGRFAIVGDELQPATQTRIAIGATDHFSVHDFDTNAFR